MKKTSLVILAFALFAGIASAQQAVSVTLRWDYPATAEPARSQLEFVLYTSDNLSLPLSEWAVASVVPGTNISTTAVSQTSHAVLVLPAPHFFYVTARDTFWGLESVPSNTYGTPAPVLGVPPFGLTIFRTP